MHNLRLVEEFKNKFCYFCKGLGFEKWLIAFKKSQYTQSQPAHYLTQMEKNPKILISILEHYVVEIHIYVISLIGSLRQVIEV